MDDDFNTPEALAVLFDLAREIRAIRPGFPVIMMTGLNDAAFNAEAARCNVRSIVSKPVSLTDLDLFLQKFLDLGALRRAMATTGYTEVKDFQRVEVTVHG